MSEVENHMLERDVLEYEIDIGKYQSQIMRLIMEYENWSRGSSGTNQAAWLVRFIRLCKNTAIILNNLNFAG